MPQYLLSVHSVDGAVEGSPAPEDMESFMERVYALEADMKAQGAFVFTGGLHSPDTATVVDRTNGEVIMTDGPFAEAKEHIAGFYVINADDLDVALDWAVKVVDAVNHAIEVRPFVDMPSA